MKSGSHCLRTLRGLAATAVVMLSPGCGEKPGAKGPAEMTFTRAATAADLEGTWKADFAESWTLSREGFLKDTMRGASAYSKDPAEKEAQVKKEVEAFLGGMTQTYLPGGKMTQHFMSEVNDGEYKVTASDGPQLTVEQTAGRKQTVTVTFIAEGVMRWHPGGKAPVTIVFRRQ